MRQAWVCLLSVVCLSVRNVGPLLWLNGASQSKSWQPIGSRIWDTKIDTKMNDLDFCLEVVSRSCQVQPLRYIRRWISRKLYLVRLIGSNWPPAGNGIWAIKWSRDRWRHVTPNVLWGSTVGYPSDSLAYCLRFGFIRKDKRFLFGSVSTVCELSVTQRHKAGAHGGRWVIRRARPYKCRDTAR